MGSRNTLTALASSVLISISLLSSPSFADELRPGIVLYKLNENASAKELKSLNALLHSQGLQQEKVIPDVNIHMAKFAQSGREKAIANILQASGYVKFAEPDYLVAPTLEPNDSDYGLQWHHPAINSPQAWDATTGSHNVLVAVCDTGVDTDHPDLVNNLTFPGFDAHVGFDTNGNVISTDVEDFHGHGTGTAGTLGAVGNNITGVAGVNWDTSILPVRIAISETNSSAYISSMVNCMVYAGQRGAKIVNISYGGISSASINDAATNLRNQGGLLFMSAGNDYNEHPEYPDYTSLVGVGATDQNNVKASFSSYGDYVDVVAPGVSIRTTYINGGYTYYSGTSFSSPMTAGVGALMVAANPAITPDEIENGLFSTATDLGAAGDDNIYGHGLINAQAAINYALNLGNYQPPVADIWTDSTTVSFGTPILFNAGNSYDADGSVVSYHWDFGDGTTADIVDPSHNYQQSGVFEVSLTVTDNDNLSDSATLSIQVTNELPIAVIDPMATSYNLGDTVSFNGYNSYDPDPNGAIVSHEWDFGNGQTASGESVQYSYPAGGLYNATLTVTDNAGASNASSIQIEVIDPSVLLAPSALSATVSGQDVTLNWQDNSANENGFVVERAMKIRGKYTFETIATLGADSTSFTDSVAELGTYQYRVYAFNDSNQVYSDAVLVKVETTSTEPPPPPEPGTLVAPDNLSATLNGSTVTLTWNDNSTDESGFYIERGVKVRGQITYSRVATVGTDTASYSETLASGTYEYRVQAFNDSGTSSYSNSVSVRLK
ncbi:S8 family serine peptidase [Thiomicrorhabdus xiamenensis]|uniref:S8 family serine peptidase n=1 Tax=Thiomicrorhabdus xiamenensis TaxID=2739063 RepID=A0A7D4SMA4_9GAMM|nr:S8 family serine peptidase [Thiomicrorhabdus xiamenensis]QKI88321.1 S8 family serine peptidase [Thiomicrorhabdus xiamenensis]